MVEYRVRKAACDDMARNLYWPNSANCIGEKINY